MSLPLSSSPATQSQMPINDNKLSSLLGKHPSRSGPPAPAAISSAVDKRQSALELVDKTLADAYAKLGWRQGSGASAFKAFEPLTAEKAAANILGFIERRLKMDIADGATREQLESRLEAGLAGFKKGFAEASEKLKALSMLSPEIKEDIGRTYDLVLNGIDQLRDRLINSQDDSARQQPADKEVRAAGAEARKTLAAGSYEFASASRFSFQLTTAEGDKVTINATQSSAQSASFVGGKTAVSAAESRSFNWVVEGDLSAAEKQAIEELLGQVQQLAQSFFNGDLDSAFEQALSIGYDSEQILAFSLSLTQVEVKRVSAAYSAQDQSAAPAISDSLQPLGDFVRGLLDALDSASEFPRPAELLSDLAGKVVAEQEGETPSPAQRFREFVEMILAKFEAE